MSWNSFGGIGKTTKDQIRITDVPSEIRNGYFPTKSTYYYQVYHSDVAEHWCDAVWVSMYFPTFRIGKSYLSSGDN